MRLPQMAYIIALLFIGLCMVKEVDAHGYLNTPKSRNLLAREKGLNYCPHCWNGGTAGTVKANDPDGWEYPETVETSARHGLCGDPSPNVADQQLMKGGNLYSGEIQATYQQGGTIDISIWVDTHHHGWFEFFLCDKGDLSNPSGEITQECLLKHQLMRSPNDPSESPIDSQYPGRYYMYPKCHDSLNDGKGLLYMQYTLPAEVTCTHCVLQWWWVTANTCSGGGYENPDIFPNTYSSCSGDGGAQGWFPRDVDNVCSGTTYPEEFWNCADIQILPSDGPISTSAPTPLTTPSPTIRTTPSPMPSETPAPTKDDATCAATWESCGGDAHDNRECCSSGDECKYVNQWYHQCQPSNNGGGGGGGDGGGDGEQPDNCDTQFEDLGPVDSSGFAISNGKLKLGGDNNVQLVNENGTPIQLQGMSSHGVHWFPDCYTFESIEFLVKNWGITVFRAAMYIGEGGYATNPSDFNIVKNIVDWCETLGIYVIIDWHILTPGDPNYWLSGNGKNDASAASFWREVADLYKDKKHVLYEIANEPNGVEWPAVKSYSDEIISIIREIDSETIIIVGTPTWSQDIDKAAADPVAEPYNVMYAFHFYAGTHDFLYDRVVQFADQIPIFATEWGTSTASGNGGPYFSTTQRFLDLFKEKKISWAQWSYADKAETSAALIPGACEARLWDDTSCSGSFLKNYIKLNSGILPATRSPTAGQTTITTSIPTSLSTPAPTLKPTPLSTPTPTLKPTPLATSTPTSNSNGCALLYEQCDGGQAGLICCTEGTTCVYENPYYSQCKADPNRTCKLKDEQCSDVSPCCTAYTCVEQNPYYSQCQ